MGRAAILSETDRYFDQPFAALQARLRAGRLESKGPGAVSIDRLPAPVSPPAGVLGPPTGRCPVATGLETETVATFRLILRPRSPALKEAPQFGANLPASPECLVEDVPCPLASRAFVLASTLRRRGTFGWPLRRGQETCDQATLSRGATRVEGDQGLPGAVQDQLFIAPASPDRM
jgi:hypothetical protein